MDATETVDQVNETDEATRDELLEATRRQIEHYGEIAELNRQLVMAHQEWEVLKDRTAGKKKLCDELGKELSNLITRGPDFQQKLPFDEQEESSSTEQDDDAWRDVPITEALALSASQFEKLEEEGCKTMGQLEDYRASKGLHTIKGFGEKAVTKIEDQILDWLDDFRDRLGEDVSDQVNDEESGEAEQSEDEGLEGDDTEDNQTDDQEESEDTDTEEADELLESM